MENQPPDLGLIARMNRILIIEDDEISQSFMAQAVAPLPVTCSTCSGFTHARRLCQDMRFDLIISDVNAADGSLFEHAGYLTDSCKLLAVSAEINPSIAKRLRQVGAHEVMAKPMSIAALHEVISRLLALDDTGTAPLWDKQKAISALGPNEQILISLKAMFKAELPLMTDRIQQAYDNQQSEQIHETLHKLKASCGFLGASRLLQECYRLDADISAGRIKDFMDVADQTLTLI